MIVRFLSDLFFSFNLIFLVALIESGSILNVYLFWNTLNGFKVPVIDKTTTPCFGTSKLKVSILEFSKSFTITITEKFIRWSDKITLTYENNNEIKLALLEDSTSDRNLISNQPISNNYWTIT